MNISDMPDYGPSESLDLPSSVVTLEPVALSCASGSCPTVYRTDRGTLVVQGYVFPPETAGMDLPSGESLVEIPIELLKTAALTVD